MHRCFRDGQYEQGVGIALESRRLDKLEEAVHRAPDTVTILRYALRVCQRVVASKDFRLQVNVCHCPSHALSVPQKRCSPAEMHKWLTSLTLH